MPLAARQALGIAVMSYNGHLGFGLLGDYDALPELEAIADDLKWAIASLYRAAGLAPKAKRSQRKQPRRSPTAPPRDQRFPTRSARKPASAG